MAKKSAPEVGLKETPEVHKKATKAAIPVAEKKQEYEEVTMLSVEEAGLKKSFVAMAEEILDLNARRKALDDKIKEKTLIARATMEELNDKESWSARGDGWSVSYVRPKPRQTLVRELLILQGVSMKVIEKATKETESTPFVVFRAAKEE